MIDSLVQCEHCGKGTRLSWRDGNGSDANTIYRVARLFFRVHRLAGAEKIEFSGELDVEAVKKAGLASLSAQMSEQIAKAARKLAGEA